MTLTDLEARIWAYDIPDALECRRRVAELDDTERTILYRVAGGIPINRIGRQLEADRVTIQRHLDSVFDKLGVHPLIPALAVWWRAQLGEAAA